MVILSTGKIKFINLLLRQILLCHGSTTFTFFFTFQNSIGEDISYRISDTKYIINFLLPFLLLSAFEEKIKIQLHLVLGKIQMNSMKSNLNYTIQYQIITISNYVLFHFNRLAAAKFKMDIPLHSIGLTDNYVFIYQIYLLICTFIYLYFQLYYLYNILSIVLSYNYLLLYRLYSSIRYSMSLL